MKIRIIDVEGEPEHLLPLVTLLLESGGIDQLAATTQVREYLPAAVPSSPVEPGPRPKRKAECRKCGKSYQSTEHRASCGGPRPPGMGVCGICRHYGTSRYHREQCRGELVASPGVGNGDREIAELRQPTGTRCAHCGGAMYVDDGERKCLNCGRPARPLESYTLAPLGPEKQRRRGPTVQGVKV